VNRVRGTRRSLVPLCLLGLNKIRKREQIERRAARQLDRSAPAPEPFEGIDSAHARHHIHTQAFHFGMMTTEMDGVALAQIFQIERRNGDDFGVQINHRLSKCRDISKTGDDGKIEIAAEFSGAEWTSFEQEG